MSFKPLAGLADQEVQNNAGCGPSEHYNVKTTLAFGEAEAKIEFKEHGILLADGSQCFFKGWKVYRRFPFHFNFETLQV